MASFTVSNPFTGTTLPVRRLSLALTYTPLLILRTLFSQISSCKPILNLAFRSHILIEICFKESQDFEPVYRDAGSLLHIYSQRELEIKRITCTDPRQIFADKISALIWRIPDCNRTIADSDSQKLDNTIIRHLYDICKLAEALSIDSPELITLIESKISNDMTRDRSGTEITISAQEYGLRTIATLKDSTLWKDSYRSYVSNFA